MQKQLLTAAFFALFLAFSPFFAAHAQDALLTSDVSMDITGTDANDAREKAMQQAERDGLAALFEKLAPEEKEALMEKLEEDVISAMVKGVEVLDEKIAGPRYRAQLRVSYNAIAVNALLDKKVGAEGSPEPAVDVTSSSILVIPVYEEDGKVVIWEPTNPWRDAWKRAVQELPGGNLVMAYGDTQDMAALTAETSSSANFAALLPFYKRYGVGEIVIARARYQTGTKSEATIIEVLRRHISKERSDVFMIDYRPDMQEDKDALFYRSARDLAQQVNRQRDELMAKQAMTAQEADGRLMVLIPMTTLDSWTTVRQRLLKLQTITRMDVLAISPEQVDVMLRYKGSLDSLENDVGALGLRAIRSDRYWIISKD